MSNIPSHGNATRNQVGNAREGYRQGSMSGRYAPGMAGGHQMQTMCHFPAPPPARVYCNPAPFTSLNGASKFRLIDAYGTSRPKMSYY